MVGGNFIDVAVWSMKDLECKNTLSDMHNDTVTCMTIDGYFLFTGSDDRSIVMWNLNNYTQVGVLNGHKRAIQDLLMLKNGYLVSCAFDYKVHVWDYNLG